MQLYAAAAHDLHCPATNILLSRNHGAVTIYSKQRFQLAGSVQYSTLVNIGEHETLSLPG